MKKFPVSVYPNTALFFLYKDIEYIPSEGVKETWKEISYTLGVEKNTLFPAEWRSVYGAELLQAHTTQIEELATVRMGFNPFVYEVLRSKKVKIWKNNNFGMVTEDEPDKNAFTIIGSPENVMEKNMIIEFKVSRYEVIS